MSIFRHTVTITRVPACLPTVPHSRAINRFQFMKGRVRTGSGKRRPRVVWNDITWREEDLFMSPQSSGAAGERRIWCARHPEGS